MYLFLWLRLNWLQTDFGNDFLENGDVWLLLQIRSNWKAFLVDRIWEPKQRKWFFISIFTSNDFWPWKIEERERENRSQHHRPSTSPAGAVEREREREKKRIDRDITGWCGSADRDCDRNWRFDLCAIAIDASRKRVDRDSNRAKRRLLQSRSRRSRSRLRLSGFDDFFLDFVCVLRNKWYYIFVW